MRGRPQHDRRRPLGVGGYHAGAISAAAAREQKKLDAQLEAMVIGDDDDDDWGPEEEEDDDVDDAPVPTWQEEAESRAGEVDDDITWLRERGHGAAEALAAKGGVFVDGEMVRRVAMLGVLQPREESEADEPDEEAAAAGRVEEREVLESIMGEGMLIELGGSSFCAHHPPPHTPTSSPVLKDGRRTPCRHRLRPWLCWPLSVDAELTGGCVCPSRAGHRLRQRAGRRACTDARAPPR